MTVDRESREEGFRYEENECKGRLGDSWGIWRQGACAVQLQRVVNWLDLPRPMQLCEEQGHVTIHTRKRKQKKFTVNSGQKNTRFLFFRRNAYPSLTAVEGLLCRSRHTEAHQVQATLHPPRFDPVRAETSGNSV